MRIVAHAAIIDYYTKHADAKSALKEWYTKTKKAAWLNFVDVKTSFNSVDIIGDKRFVFNIKGNSYRLVAIILFEPQMVFIRFIGTHAEYDKINCAEI